MRLGDIELDLLSDGTLRLDGGGLYGPVPKPVWNAVSPADSRNRVKVGLNCLLIRAGGKRILVDTGAGSKHPLRRQHTYAMKADALPDDLRAHGLGVEDIDVVALTHLHFDHAGGATRFDPAGKVVPTFPNASYLVQRRDWEEASHPNERARFSYIAEDFLPLAEHRQLELLDGDTQIAPGVWMKVTGGHTPGHQSVQIESDGQRAACLGDVLPTPNHLPVDFATAWDTGPLDTMECKRQSLSLAEREGWLLIFGHGLGPRAGYLVRDEGGLALKPQEL